MKHLALVIPVFNDWPSVSKLIDEIGKQNELRALESIQVLAINDGSTRDPDPSFLQDLDPDGRVRVSLLHLKRNVGHQNAIATGLGWVAQAPFPFDAVIVMDGDGEDRPQDIPLLIEATRTHPGTMIIAARGRRNESLGFRMGYWIYKRLFWVLTGQKISFGNFSLLPVSCLPPLIHSRDIWNSYAGGILRSKLPRQFLRIDRGVRYYGRSKMNLTSLILHGLNAISVFVDVCTVRVLFMSLGLIGISVIGTSTVILMKLLGHASPGWASTMALLMMVISLQCVLLSTILTFILFVYRNINTESPVSAYPHLVKEVATAGQSLPLS
jgi:glycosyltransferase involved in cell wall biosynthesis